jgi:hypothetical protein
MVKIMDLSKTKERDVFWEAYRACAEEKRVGPDRSPFYVGVKNWGQTFKIQLSPFPPSGLKEQIIKIIYFYNPDN